MFQLAIGDDDFITGTQFVKIGSIARVIATDALMSDGSLNKFQAEKEAWGYVHSGIVAGELRPLHETTLNLLGGDEYGNGIVTFDELVAWGQWCHRFDFVTQTALALKASRKARLERAITPQGSGCAPRYSPPPITVKPPNWGKWRHMPIVAPWEACTLALNIDPDSVDYMPESWDGQPETWHGFPYKEIGDHFLNLLRLLNANQFEKQHFTENFAMGVRLSEFAAWCANVVRDLTDGDIPQELAALAVEKLPEASGESSDTAAKVEAGTGTSPSGDVWEVQAPAADADDHDETILMNALSISLLAVLLLPLAGCGEKAAGSKTEAETPLATANQSGVPQKNGLPEGFRYLTAEEEFAETKKKADAGNAIAQLNLGGMYAFGNGVSKDAAKAVEWWQKAAVQGDDTAQYNLGLMHVVGAGVPKDVSKAVEWFQKAAVQGNADAQNRLGEVHLGGENSLFNLAKAAEWFQKAAVQGHVDAQKNLGWMYANGLSVPENAVKAFDWYLKAAMQGDASAQFKIGVRYAKGDGVSKDAAKAVEWYQKASAQGDAKAQYNLGVMYAFGNGVPKDAAKAVEWFQKAAAQGDADAQYNLGVMYAKGDGVSKDMVRAYAWANLAAAQGHKNEKKMRDLFEKFLTANQRAEGQRLASNWKKGDILQASSDNPSGPTSPDGKPSKKGTGTAFAVSSTGHALTNHHVINGCTEVKVAGREGIAKVLTSDSVNDLALLQLPGKSQDIASLNPDPGKLRQGEDIIVFGYPLEWALSSGGNLTPGTISALTGLGNNTNQIQITAPIQPGSSGSPVMDKNGNVVGMVSMKLSDSKMAKATGQIGQNVNFAVNGQTVKAFLDANKVPYKTGGGLFSREKSNADIAEEASKWTVLVECWK